jgi:hypothetical protein
MGSTLSKPVWMAKNVIFEKKRGAWVQVIGLNPRKHYSKSRPLTRRDIGTSPCILEPKNNTSTNNLRIAF